MTKSVGVHIHRAGLLVALVGPPNSGKTALFNQLTGGRQKVANYSGVTVDRKEGRFTTASGLFFRLLDLPGIYSLYPRSLDERLTVDVLLGRAKGERKPDRVLCVIDATSLARGLRLVLSVSRLGIPCIAVLNRVDLAQQRGIVIDTEALSAELGLIVIPCVSKSFSGTEQLRSFLSQNLFWTSISDLSRLDKHANQNDSDQKVCLTRNIKEEEKVIHSSVNESSVFPSDSTNKILDKEKPFSPASVADEKSGLNEFQDVDPENEVTGSPFEDSVKKSGKPFLGDQSVYRRVPSPLEAESQDFRRGNHRTVQGILERLHLASEVRHSLSDRIDKVVLHPVIGPILMLVLLFSVFQAMFSWSEFPMVGIEKLSQLLVHLVHVYVPSGWIESLIVDGVISGAGSVLTFLPQILILFFFIFVLEDSGYLPRAAFLLDRIMRGVGLSGRAFIPLVSSFACAIPGIMSARTIAHSRDRMITILVAPLMTCSARLPIYTLLISAFIPAKQIVVDLIVFHWKVQLQGLVLFGLYCLGVFSAVLVSILLKKMQGSSEAQTLMMELPDYQWPVFRSLVLGLWFKAIVFIKRVGTTILLLTVFLWFLASFPRPPAGFQGPPIHYSFAGAIGRSLSYVFKPIGFNWEISIALVPGLAAREVAVSALGTVYSLSSEEKESGALISRIAKEWKVSTGISLLLWYVFAPQCVSTFLTMRRETGSWKIPAIAVSYLFALAYLVSFLGYRFALFLGL